MTTLTHRIIEFERPTDVYDAVHAAAGRIRFLDVPEHRFLAVDGRGAPGEMPFREAMAALYPVAYTLHFALRRREVAAPIGAMEGLFWIEPDHPLPLDVFGSAAWRPQDWHWRLMLPIPSDATGAEVVAAIDDVASTKAPPALGLLRIETYREGPSAQTLHVGPYDAEIETVQRLHDAVRDAGYHARGCHHEIYISDPNRTPADRLKTVIRQPVEPVA